MILGGSSGLGLASALKLASEGMNICIVHRDSRAAMEKISEEFENISKITALMTFNLDASRPENIERIAAALASANAKVRVLLHSIARGSLKGLTGSEALCPDDLSITMESMATSLLSWTQALHKNKIFADDARVLAFSSEGSRRPMQHYAAVSMAKAALEALIRSIALEFRPFGIRANCIQAGVTDTHSLRAIPGAQAILEHSASRNPSGRNTRPEDIANVVYLLCRDESAWINGTVICADGGESLQ